MRYRTLATFFSKEELGLFLAAFRLPDFIFEVLVSGALTSAFIPIFIKYEKNEKELSENISSIINFIIVGLFILILIVLAFSGFLIPLISPNLNDEQLKQIISMSQILIISQLPLLVLGNILSGIAQANKIFIITAIAPILYNLGIIIGTLAFSNSFYLNGPITGVVIGAALFLIAQIPILFISSFRYHVFHFKLSVLKDFVRLFLPRFFNVITAQIDLTIDMTIALFLGTGSYTIFFFAQHLQFFPVAFIGMAFGQASLPYLSDLYRENKINEIKKIFIDSCLQLLFLSIPIAIFFIFARTPIIRLFFGGEKFDWEGTVLTAKTLSYFAISLPFHTIFYFIVRAFYATFDTKTPFIVNVVCIVINTVLSLLFVLVFKFPIWSLGLAFSIAIIINVILLAFLFYKKVNGFNMKRLIFHTFRLAVLALLAALPSYPLMKILDRLILDTTRTINIFFLLVIVGAFFTSLYLLLCWICNAEEIYILGKLLKKVKSFKKKSVEINTDTG